MIKFLNLLVFLFVCQTGLAQVDTLKVIHNKSEYINISKTGNTKLLIFLHGGVSNTYFEQNKDISLEYLLEGNAHFISIASENKFDVLIPITNTNLNWINKSDFCFNEFKSFIQAHKNDYTEIWISGFSDGGTGSFKMFYTHNQYFKGLISFNGFPHHNGFTSKVNYEEVTDKKVVFFGTKNDKRIKYEWSLAEYSKQKKFNPNTFIYVTDGNHSFNVYKENDFELLFKILLEVDNKDKNPLHGLILEDKLIEFYDFRKSIVRKYRFGEEIYKENKQQKRKIKTLVNRR